MASRSRIRKLSVELVEKRIDFREFWKSTAGEWAKLADYVLNKWKVPAAVSREDVVQEMAIAVFRYTPHWKPTGAEPGKYFVFQAITAAKRWIHKQRGVRGDKDPSRHAFVFASMGKDEASAAQRTEVPEEPGQEAVIGIADEFGPLIAALVRTDGDVEAATELVAKLHGVNRQRARRAIEAAVERFEVSP